MKISSTLGAESPTYSAYKETDSGIVILTNLLNAAVTVLTIEEYRDFSKLYYSNDRVEPPVTVLPKTPADAKKTSIKEGVVLPNITV